MERNDYKDLFIILDYTDVYIAFENRLAQDSSLIELTTI